MKVDVFFTYDKGQEVVVTKTGKRGIVKHREFHIYDNENKTTVTEKYNVNMGSLASTSFSVDEIEPVDQFYELKESDKVHDFLIDVQLKNGDFEFVKRLHNEKING